MNAAGDRAAQIRARLAAATQGSWEYVRSTRSLWGASGRSRTASAVVPQDGDLLANAPADLGWLLAERTELLLRIEQAERAGAVKALESLLADIMALSESDAPVETDLFSFIRARIEQVAS